MLLTRRTLFLLLLDLLLDALLLAGATFEPTLFYFAVAYVCIVLLMVLADRRLTPPPSDFELTRTNDQRLSLGADNLVVVRVTHRARAARRTVRVVVRDEYPAQFRAANQSVLALDCAVAVRRRASANAQPPDHLTITTYRCQRCGAEAGHVELRMYDDYDQATLVVDGIV